MGVVFPAAQHGGKQDIFQGRQLRQEKIGLKHKSHAAVAQECFTIPLESKELLALEFDTSLPRMLQTSKDVEEG